MITDQKFHAMQHKRAANPIKKHHGVPPDKVQKIKRMYAEKYTMQQIASVVRVPIIDVRIILRGLSWLHQ